MPPINTIVVQTILLPEDRRDETVLKQAKNLLTKALIPVDESLHDKEFLIGKFSAADIMIGDAIRLAKAIGWQNPNYINLEGYFARLGSRPAFLKALELS